MKFKSLKFAPHYLNKSRVIRLTMENIMSLNEHDHMLVYNLNNISLSLRELAGRSNRAEQLFSSDYSFIFDEK